MIKDAVFDFIYGEAINDLYWRNKQSGKKALMEKDDNIKKIVKSYIDSVMQEKSPCTLLTIKQIANVKDKNKEEILNFGNAQKLVNMTIKYFYTICYANEDLRKKFVNCHAPMDSIMLALVISKSSDEKISKELKNISWSSLSNSDSDIRKYELFQSSINTLCQTHCQPIEFDYLYWNKAKIAKGEYETNRIKNYKSLYDYMDKTVKINWE